MNYTIVKGEGKTLPYRVDDLLSLTGYDAHFTVSATEFGAPIAALSKSNIAGVSSGIAINTTERNVDVLIAVADFNYSSAIAVGTYYFQLFLIDTSGATDEPRMIDRGTIEVIDSIHYKAL